MSHCPTLLVTALSNFKQRKTTTIGKLPNLIGSVDSRRLYQLLLPSTSVKLSALTLSDDARHRIVDEQLMNRSLRRMHIIDAQLRADSGNSLVGMAATICRNFKLHRNNEEAFAELAAHENLCQERVESCQQELDKIRNEGGVSHTMYHDGVKIRSRMETMLGYVADLREHGVKGTLFIARQERGLLYQKS